MLIRKEQIRGIKKIEKVHLGINQQTTYSNNEFIIGDIPFNIDELDGSYQCTLNGVYDYGGGLGGSNKLLLRFGSATAYELELPTSGSTSTSYNVNIHFSLDLYGPLSTKSQIFTGYVGYSPVIFGTGASEYNVNSISPKEVKIFNATTSRSLSIQLLCGSTSKFVRNQFIIEHKNSFSIKRYDIGI